MKPTIARLLAPFLFVSLFTIAWATVAQGQGLQSESYRLESGALRAIGLATPSIGGSTGTRLTEPTTSGAFGAGSSSGATSGIQLEGGWITSPVPVPEPSGCYLTLAALITLARRRDRRSLVHSHRAQSPSLIAALLVFFAAGLASAGPSAISYQGTLVDVAGDPLVGPVDIDFSFYASAAPSDVTVLYSEEHLNVGLDAFGGFTLSVGTGSSPSGTFGPTLFQTDDLFLEISVEGETLEPRQPILSVPWSLVATELEGAPDLITEVSDATSQLASFSAAFPGSGLGDTVSAIDDAVGSLQASLSALTGDSSDSVVQQLAAASVRLDSIEAIVGTPLTSSSDPIATSDSYLDFEMASAGSNPIFALIKTHGAAFGDAYELEFMACDDAACSSSTTRSIASGHMDSYEICDFYDFDPETGEEFCVSWMMVEDYYAILQQNVVLGSDGFPVLTYLDGYTNDLVLVHCSESSCATTDPPVTLSDGTTTYSSASRLIIGASGNPIVAFFDSVNDRLEMIVCTNALCTSTTTTTATLATTGVSHLSIALGDDGSPVMALYDGIDRDLEFARCGDSACATIQASTLASTGFVGREAQIAIGSDGAPIIAFRNQTDSVVQTLKCDDDACSGTGAAQSLSLAAGTPTYSPLSLSVNDSGRPVLAWTTSPDDSLVTLTCWEPDCAPSPNDVLHTLVTDARKPRLRALAPLPTAVHIDTSGPNEVLRMTAVDGLSTRVLANQTSAQTAQVAATGAQSTASGAQTDATSALSEIDAIESALGQGSCGQIFDIQASACPFSTTAAYIALPTCDVAPNNSFCEGDGECGTTNSLDNCLGAYDVYYKTP